MWNALSAAASYVGMGESAQPAYACAWPLKDLDPRQAAEVSAAHHTDFKDLLEAKEWALVDGFKDPEGGDMHLWSKPAVGRYHFLKCTMSVPNTTPAKFVELVTSSDLAIRQKFSADCISVKKLDEPTPTTSLLAVQYWTPPPVAQRDFCMLSGTRENDDGSMDVWGCSVASDLAPEQGYSVVRGTTLWGWHLVPVGDHVLASWVNCFDPRGWTPSFLLEWLKTTASKELCAIRSVVQGKEAKLEKVGIEDVGMSQADLDKAYAEQEKQAAAAAAAPQ